MLKSTSRYADLRGGGYKMLTGHREILHPRPVVKNDHSLYFTYPPTTPNLKIIDGEKSEKNSIGYH